MNDCRCGKVSYESRQDASLAIRRFASRRPRNGHAMVRLGPRKLQVYGCPDEKGAYHVGHGFASRKLDEVVE